MLSLSLHNSIAQVRIILDVQPSCTIDNEITLCTGIENSSLTPIQSVTSLD